MSKFIIKVEMQGLKIEVEGTKEDAPRIAQQLGKQFGNLLQSPAALASGNGSSVIEGDIVNDDGAGKKPKKARKSSGGGGTKTPAEELSFVHDSGQYGSPQQGWTQVQKSIWFLYIVEKQANVTQLTSYSIAKNFNHHFKASGQINGGNVMKGLDKEKLKGTNATVGADMTDGTAKYFLTTAGKAIAQMLAKGETVAE
jgi:hypothetical protein